MTPREKAYTIYQDTEASMSDLADCSGEMFTSYDEKEAEADRLWNSPDDLRDLIGDKIFWASNSMKTDDDKELASKICKNLYNIGHSAMKEAVMSFVEDHIIIDWR